MSVLPLLGACVQAPVAVQPMAPPVPVVSYVNIPVSIPLASLQAQLDAAIERTHGVEPFHAQLNGGSAPPACGVDAGYAVERDGLVLGASNGAVVTTVPVRYWLKARKQVPCPGETIEASCGAEGEDPRRAQIAWETRMEILPDLSTRVQSTPRPVVAEDRCVLQPFGLDITAPLTAAFDSALRKWTPEVDRRVSAVLDLRQRMQAAWLRMSEPREIQQGVWLAWKPEGIGIVPIVVDAEAVTTGIQLRVRPAVVVGAKPDAAQAPMPPAYSASPDDAFGLQLPIQVQSAYVQEKLDHALGIREGGMPVSVGNVSTRIVAAEITGSGAQVQVRVQFAGDVSGTALLAGTPVYDPGTRDLMFPDLDYTLDSDQFLLKSANLVAHSQVRDRLRQRFTIDLGSRIDELRAGLESLLNRRNDNVQLRGSVEKLSLLGVSRQSKDEVFTAYLSIAGKVSAEVDLPVRSPTSPAQSDK
jgi:hypothetical protein